MPLTREQEDIIEKIVEKFASAFRNYVIDTGFIFPHKDDSPEMRRRVRCVSTFHLDEQALTGEIDFKLMMRHDRYLQRRIEKYW